MQMPALADFVASTKVTLAPPRRLARIPDGNTSLILRLTCDSADLHVLGPRTSTLYKQSSPGQAIKITFRPGGAVPFFGMPLCELANRVLPLHEIWGGQALAMRDALAAARTDAHRIAIFENALARRLMNAGVEADARRRQIAYQVTRLSEPGASVAALANELGTSARSLRRSFSSAVGISPKRYARIVRFKRALAFASEKSLNWSAIAVACGYFDQAHMSADFREFTGLPPEHFIRSVATDTGSEALSSNAHQHAQV